VPCFIFLIAEPSRHLPTIFTSPNRATTYPHITQSTIIHRSTSRSILRGAYIAYQVEPSRVESSLAVTRAATQVHGHTSPYCHPGRTGQRGIIFFIVHDPNGLFLHSSHVAPSHVLIGSMTAVPPSPITTILNH
jgi:hypothetical protein